MARKSNSGEYWKKRFQQIEEAQHQDGVQVYAEIEKQYRTAQRQIEGQIQAWYGRFATNNGVTIQEARRMLSAKELAELKWDVQQYIQYGEQNALSGTWVKELENASARFHISRLEALKLQTQQSLEVLFGNQLDSFDRGMRELYKSGYYRTAFEVQKGFGIGWDFATLDDKQIDKVIRKPWAVDGKNFSERIWGNKQKLINELNQTLTKNIVLGQDPQKAIDEIARKMNSSKTAAGRLVMTEEAFFSSAAQKDCFTELDVEQYEIVATLDSHTSDICQEMDGKHFPMSQWEVGVTAPPFHVWCRTTTVPYFGDEFDLLGERAARGEDGKTYHVPANMTYPEWKKSFVDGGDKGDLQEVTPGDTIKVEQPQKLKTVTTVEEAKKALIDDVGFVMVEDSLSIINDEQYVYNTNQLLLLENKFGCIKKSGGMTICSEPSKNACAYVSTSRTHAPRASDSLSLCPKSYKITPDETIAALQKERTSKWCMPFADGNEISYNVTHEYGHILQNLLEQQRMIENGLDLNNPMQFIDRSKLMSTAKKTRLKAYKWYTDISKEVQDECFDEIIAIAKQNNPDFSIADNLSEYGRTDKCEFFAEVFANSQLGEPNELGNAMNIWLERKGLIK